MPNIIDLLHMLAFKNMDKKRDRHMKFSSAKRIKRNFKINNTAKSLHPDSIRVVVEEVMPTGKDSIVVTFSPLNGGAFPYFRAGQYITVDYHTKDGDMKRPYSICSSPQEALNGILRIMIKKVPEGIASNLAFEIMEPDRVFTIHGPFGDFHYDFARDNYHVIALAGGSGITPFLSMAHAIAEGDEDFSLTILYGSKDRSSICLYEEIKRVADTERRVKLVPILSDEVREGFESGFITEELIEKYTPLNDSFEKVPISVFVCGPEAMYQAMEPILQRMGLDKKQVRFECSPGERPVRETDEVAITVHQGNEAFTVYGRKNETIIMALDRAEVHSPSRCRSGSCGYCRGRLIKGDVTVPPELTDPKKLNHNGFDHRRAADKEMGIVHLCVTYPDTDIEIEIIG